MRRAARSRRRVPSDRNGEEDVDWKDVPHADIHPSSHGESHEDQGGYPHIENPPREPHGADGDRTGADNQQDEKR